VQRAVTPRIGGEAGGGAAGAADRRRQAEALARVRRRRFLAEAALALALPWLAWASGLAGALAAGLGTLPLWPRTALVVATLLFAYRLALLPLDYVAGYRLSLRYGLTTQTTAAWLLDWLKVTALSLLLGTFLALLLYACVDYLGASWWWVYGLVLSAGIVLLSYVAPYVLLPLFFRLRPLDAGPLTERIDALFAAVGVAKPRIAAIDLSTRTTAANAAVIGLGSSRRVVLGDTLLAHFGLDEIETVVAHELGHHVHADVWRAIGAMLVAVWAGLAVAAWVLDPLLRQLGIDWRALAAFPLLVLLVELGALVALPALNAVSRGIERSADRYALEVTRKPAAYVAAMRKLESQNLVESQPPRWAEWLLYTHPPVEQRVRAAEAYGATLAGGAPRA
jgi:STE24 endopeptidase